MSRISGLRMDVCLTAKCQAVFQCDLSSPAYRSFRWTMACWNLICVLFSAILVGMNLHLLVLICNSPLPPSYSAISSKAQWYQELLKGLKSLKPTRCTRLLLPQGYIGNKDCWGDSPVRTIKETLRPVGLPESPAMNSTVPAVTVTILAGHGGLTML